MRSICVFCGSSSGRDPAFSSAATTLGTLIARRGQRLVYGGAMVGLMGEVADAALAAGGEVIGVIPEKLAGKEIAHDGLTELFVVSGMHERKAKMAELSDAFVSMPGGWGTLEETFEVLTWLQLRYHQKSVGLLNVNGYYNALLAFADHALDSGLLQPDSRSLLLDDADPEALLDRLAAVELPPAPKWMERL
ncbi:MAG: TIGR00730 family Rossman fold protein [Myxococcota bacterium]